MKPSKRWENWSRLNHDWKRNIIGLVYHNLILLFSTGLGWFSYKMSFTAEKTSLEISSISAALLSIIFPWYGWLEAKTMFLIASFRSNPSIWTFALTNTKGAILFLLYHKFRKIIPSKAMQLNNLSSHKFFFNRNNYYNWCLSLMSLKWLWNF